MTEIPLIPISWGELFDKITILELKKDHLVDKAASQNVIRELSLLKDAVARLDETAYRLVLDDLEQLKKVNMILWDIENKIRQKEVFQQFDNEFIQLARAVYKTNDLRAELKKTINKTLRSEIQEEKVYTNPSMPLNP